MVNSTSVTCRKVLVLGVDGGDGGDGTGWVAHMAGVVVSLV